MKYIHGFLSSRLKEVGISHDESLVIRYLLNFINSNKMEKILVNGEFYYWVKYEKVASDLVILGIKKQAISDMLHYDLGTKPHDWEERLNSMSASTRKKREKAKFLGIFKRYTKKDAEGTRSYFAPTNLLYSLLPNITEDDGDMKNKKASTVPPVKATNTNKNNIDTNIIPQNNKKYSPKNKENKNSKPNRFHNCRNKVLEYTRDELDEILKENEKRKKIKKEQTELKEKDCGIDNINIQEYVKNSIMNAEYFKKLEDEYKIMVIDYIDMNKVFKPNWIKI